MERGENSPQGEPNKNLEGLFAEHFDEITELIDRFEDGNRAFVIDKIEQAYPQLRAFSERFTELIYTGEPTAEAKDVSYRSLHMALSTYSILSNNEPQMDFALFLDQSNGITGQQLADFAASHPAIMGVVERSGRLLDPTGKHTSLSHSMAIITFMMLEQGPERHATLFANQLDSWDGDISELTFQAETDDSNLDNDTAIRAYFAEANSKLDQMQLGPNRDTIADAYRMKLNEAWSKLECMGKTLTFDGDCYYATVQSKEYPNGGPEYFDAQIHFGPAKATGTSLGFAYESMQGGQPARLFYKVNMGDAEGNGHPTFETTHSVNVFFLEDCVISADPEDAVDDTSPGEPKVVASASVMSEAELAIFNELEFPKAKPEIFHIGGAEILSICSQGLRRRMNSRAFKQLSQRQQGEFVERYIAATAARSEIIDMRASLEPEYAFIMRPASDKDERLVPTKVLFDYMTLSGTVKNIGLMTNQLVVPKQRRLPKTLFLGLEIDDTYLLPDNTVLRPTENVVVPITGHDFEGTFLFHDDTAVTE